MRSVTVYSLEMKSCIPSTSSGQHIYIYIYTIIVRYVKLSLQCLSRPTRSNKKIPLQRLQLTKPSLQMT
jgi:hypothetical protein